MANEFVAQLPHIFQRLSEVSSDRQLTAVTLGSREYTSDLSVELSAYSPGELKRIGHYGTSQILKRVAPDLPFYEDPASDACRRTIAETYLELQLDPQDDMTVADYPLRAINILERLVSPVIRSTAKPIDDIDFAITESAHLRSLGYPDVAPASIYRDLFFDRLVKGAAFGGANQLLLAIGLNLTGQNRNHQVVMGGHEFLTLSPRIRNAISTADFKRLTHYLASADLNTQNKKSDQERLLDGFDPLTGTITKTLTKVDYRSAPEIDRGLINGDAVGCPARAVRGLLHWSTPLLLTACEVIAATDVKTVV